MRAALPGLASSSVARLTWTSQNPFAAGICFENSITAIIGEGSVISFNLFAGFASHHLHLLSGMIFKGFAAPPKRKWAARGETNFCRMNFEWNPGENFSL
jgi:hypothetical protein